MPLSITADTFYTAYCATLDDFCVVIDDPERQTVYSHNQLAVHQGALENNFLTTRSLMEPSLFDALAQVYVKHYPATDWDINLYGEQFPELIAQQHRSSKAHACNWQWLASIASIEYAICQIYYADNGNFERDGAYLIEPFMFKNSENIASLLQQHHPYITIAAVLDPNNTIKLWRDNYHIRIENS